MEMIKAFQNFIREHKLIPEDRKILIALSGGIDSSVLCYLFQKSKIPFAIAHCNFQLRGTESEKDEIFCKKLAGQYKVQFYPRKFDVKKYSAENNLSIQVAARELRYQWFNQVMKEHKYYATATAHHREDKYETFFINLLRGSGLKGLSGIPVKSGKIIRPLMFAEKVGIENFAKEHLIPFREDLSNLKNDYNRNKVRNQVFPLFERINPGFRKTLDHTIENFRELDNYFEEKIKEFRKKALTKKNNKEIYGINDLKSLEPLSFCLHYLLQDLNLNHSEVHEIMGLMDAQSGKKMILKNNIVLKDRKEIIIFPRQKKLSLEILIKKNMKRIDFPVRLVFEKMKTLAEKNLKKTDQGIAMLDYGKLHFPLSLRNWKKGDHFIPLGMKGKKKLSDFLIDQKISVEEKENVLVLESNGKIAWIVGLRLSDEFKINSSTKNIFKISIKK